MLDEVLSAIRAHYLDRYRKSIESYRTRFERSGVEVLIELRGDLPLAYRYLRVDLASGSVTPPDFTEVNSDTHLHFEALELEQGGLQVALTPLVWNGVEFRVRPPLVSEEALVEWTLKWIDPDERATADSHGLGAYIHNVTKPVVADGATEFSVDFGSAPTASVFELLACLRASGATDVELHSRTMI